MKIQFDERNNLSRTEDKIFNLEFLKQNFVNQFQESQTRALIYEGLVKFLTNFYNFTKTSFEIWIDGSFVTKKVNPNDIDIVLIIDAHILKQKGAEIENLFKSKEAKLSYKVDAYTIAEYDIDSPQYPLFQIEKAYWANWFGYTRRNRQGKRFPKGFIKLTFNGYEYQ
ncbi:MAG: DUF6932 family protein [Emticicia sp.]|uniref:DUF6932 family protein n=1 Tax=Emticicia sp. TaxID=1930953 RepID=UPI003BA5C24E